MSRQFDGSNQSLNYGSISELQSQTQLAISVLVNVDDIGSDRCVIATFGSGTTGFMLFADASGSGADRTWSFIIADSGNTGVTRIEGVTDSVQTNQWQHVYASFIANTVNGFELWIDGVEDANSPANSTGGNGDDSGGPGNNILVGEDSVNSRDFDGEIAELAVWNSGLTNHNDDMKRALADGFSPLHFPQGLAFYSPLIGRHSPEIDVVGGNTGTLNNSPTTTPHPRIVYPTIQQIRRFGGGGGAPPEVDDYLTLLGVS